MMVKAETDEFTKRADALAVNLLHFERQVFEYLQDDVKITGFSVRLPKFEGDEFFVVIRALIDGEKMVAFRSGDDLVTALRGLLGAIRGRNLKFREDRFD